MRIELTENQVNNVIGGNVYREYREDGSSVYVVYNKDGIRFEFNDPKDAFEFDKLMNR